MVCKRAVLPGKNVDNDILKGAWNAKRNWIVLKKKQGEYYDQIDEGINTGSG